MPPDLALSSTLIGSNYPCLKLILMVPKVFDPLKFDCMSQELRPKFCKFSFFFVFFFLYLRNRSDNSNIDLLSNNLLF